MKKTLFNGNWKFLKLHENASIEEFNSAVLHGNAPSLVDIPHDWLIYNAKKLYEPSTGFYIKRFKSPDSPCALLEFDGVYMDSEIYVNGKKIGGNENGYISFIIDIKPYLLPDENEIIVLARFSPPNSRWYSGAGIYRNIWLLESEVAHLVPHGCYLSCKKNEEDFDLFTETELFAPNGATLVQRLIHNGKAVFKTEHKIDASENMQVFCRDYQVKSPLLWDIESPELYSFENTILENGRAIDTDTEAFGFRTIEFCPNNGFFLNGKKTKLNGTCEHHDLGFLGAAFNERAMERRFEILKSMGVNAVRTAHNMPAAELISLADKHGVLIMSEVYDMWRLPKNKYDFARFFDECHEKDIASWVRRDRNHPSVIMWSIGNEIYDTHINETGLEISKKLNKLVLKHDKNKNAYSTLCSNYMPWENAQKCAEIVKLAGYNYSEKFYDEHHKKHPEYIIYGSETASVVQSRGIYHFPFEQSMLSDIDNQCSSLGNSTTSWGAKDAEFCIIAERDTPYSCGQFLWSGFDYIGEPTPYHTKNSYFGQIDTAGLPKDSYYIYKAAWTSYKKAPFVHIFPYWDFNERQTIDVRVASNAPTVELFLNGVSLGAQELQRDSGTHLVANYQLRYQKGALLAIAYDEERNVIARDEKHSFGESAEIQVIADKSTLTADCRDMAFLEISMTDAQNNPVENANDRVTITVTGAGRLVGLDNGDSTDYEEYKGLSRRLFSGKLVAGIMAGACEGDINVLVASDGKPDKQIQLKAANSIKSLDISAIEKNEARESLYKGSTAVRKIELSYDSTLFDENHKAVKICAKLLPLGANDALNWEIVDDRCIKSNLAQLEENGTCAIVTAKGDGRFTVRCSVCNELPHASVISQLDCAATGLGKAFVDPYEFVAGGTYFYSNGVVTNGNEHGFATQREEITVVGFNDLDFGDGCSNRITLPIFALKSVPYKLEIWAAVPNNAGADLLADVLYEMPSKWNVYQDATYTLSRALRGVCSVYFKFYDKVHVKGFQFEKQNPAFQILDGYCLENVYGDSFERAGAAINSIGNNVTLEFPTLDFTEKGIRRILICGCSHIEKNALHLRFTNDEGDEQKYVLDFDKSEKHCKKEFAIPNTAGKQGVRLVFMPGSSFDFDYMQFFQ